MEAFAPESRADKQHDPGVRRNPEALADLPTLVQTPSGIEAGKINAVVNHEDLFFRDPVQVGEVLAALLRYGDYLAAAITRDLQPFDPSVRRSLPFSISVLTGTAGRVTGSTPYFVRSGAFSPRAVARSDFCRAIRRGRV